MAARARAISRSAIESANLGLGMLAR